MVGTETAGLNFDGLPSTCLQCGYQTALSTIPSQIPPIDLLRSYYFPSLTERIGIQENISSSEITINTLEAEISKLQAATKLIQSRLVSIQKYADSNRALLSPWRKLPEEVLGNIFFYVCGGTVNVLDPSGAIWILQQVCSRWRSVVQNTPLLWSKLEAIEIDADIYLKEQSVVTRTEMCVELSKTVTLSVTSLFELGDWTGRDEAAHDILLEGLAMQAHRWRYLNFDKNSFHILVGESGNNEFLVEPGGLPCLRGLRLKGYFNVIGFCIFEGASALEIVSLEHCILPEASVFPWTNLNKLSLFGCILGSVYEKYDAEFLFKALHNLEELYLGGNIVLRLRPLLSPVTLPFLRKANIELSPELLQVLPMLRVPQLTELKTVQDEENSILVPGPLISMIQLSGCKIQKLHLKIEDPTTILPILKETQYVEQLSLEMSPLQEDSDDVFSSLEWNPEASHILPSLRELTVQPVDLDYPPVSELVDLYILWVRRVVRSRLAFASPDTAESDSLPLAPLSSVTCRIYVEPTEEHKRDVHYLKQFGEDGGVRIEFDFEGRIEVTDDLLEELRWSHSILDYSYSDMQLNSTN